MSLEDLPDDWVVWDDSGDGRAVLVFRPDVFDTEAFPAPCLPTIYVTRGPKERRRPPTDRRALADADWRVTLFLEPAVNAPERSFESRDRAIAGAVELAREFAAGDVDYRSLYRVPRESYLDRLDEVVGTVEG